MRQRSRGFVLVFSLLILLGLTSLVAVGLTRSLTEVSAGNRFTAASQAFHAAEAGMDEFLQCLNNAGCVSNSYDLQHRMLQGLNNASGPQLPGDAPSIFPQTAAAVRNLLQTPAGTLRYTWCQPHGTVVDDRYFPVCVKGVAPGMTLTDTSPEIETVVELAPPGAVTPAGAMALSKIWLGENTEVKGDVALLSHGDQEGSLKVGKGAKISPAQDGSGGRVFIYDDPGTNYSPAVNLDLSRTGNADNLLPAIKKADGTLGGPVLTGIGNSRHWPIIPNGDDVKDAKDAFLADLTASGGNWVKESTLRDFVKPYLTVPDATVDIFKKMQVLNKVLTAKEIADLGRVTRVRTNPNWNDQEQVPRITVTAGGIQYPDVNNGDWRITQGTGQNTTRIRLLNDKTGKEVYPDGPLPGGVWVLKSVDVPKSAPPLTFQASTRLYLTDHNNTGDEVRALKLGENASIRVGDVPDPNPDDLQIIVPCLGRAGGDNICEKMDEFGVCQDTKDNPDEQTCTTQNTAGLYLGKGSTVWGSIHAPTTEVTLFENVAVEGDYVVSNELNISKGAKFHSPTGLGGSGGPGGPGGAAKKVSIKLWQGR